MQSNTMRWINIKEQLPPVGVAVPFCCWVDDHFTEVNFGAYTGDKTMGESLVMKLISNSGEEWYDHWEPCSHWISIIEPESPHRITKPPQ